jgi:DNA/RNA-binding domain of Phe-tRNA-synthetase-like protein
MDFTNEIMAAFPGICVAGGDVRSVHITRLDPRLEALKQEIVGEISVRYTLERIKDEPLFRAYRDFFWSVGLDPTRTRPASEALVRRILSGGRLPVINTAVDAYNLASVRSGIPIAAFDADMLQGPLAMRFAAEGEQFRGIGMEKPVVLSKNQVILTAANQIIAIYPYRDSEATKVTPDTKNIRLLTCGVPKVPRETVISAYGMCAGFLENFTSGVASACRLFPPGP